MDISGGTAAAARRIVRVNPSATQTARAERQRLRARENLANNMMAARAAQSMSQRELSDLSGVSQEYISQAENMKRKISIDIVAVLAFFLGKTTAELLSD